MPTIKLTKRTIDALPAPVAGQVLYRDASLPGFGLRVGRRARAFFVEGQIRRRTVRTTIGRYDLISPEEARKRAKQVLANLAEGRNPNSEKAAARAREITLKQAFEALFAGRPFARSSLSSYRASMNNYLGEWRSIPIGEITRKMVMDRYNVIVEKHGPSPATNVMRHLRSVYNFTMVTHGDLPPNPVQILTQAKAWTQSKRRQTIVADHLLPQWFNAVLQTDDKVRDFLLMAMFTGMRRSEIARLRWENVDFEAKTLLVPRTKNGDPYFTQSARLLAKWPWIAKMEFACRRGAPPLFRAPCALRSPIRPSHETQKGSMQTRWCLERPRVAKLESPAVFLWQPGWRLIEGRPRQRTR